MENNQNNRQPTMEQRLETVAFMRRSAQENRYRLKQADQILNGEYLSGSHDFAGAMNQDAYAYDMDQKINPDDEELGVSFKKSFLARSVVSILVSIVFFALIKTGDERTSLYLHKIKGAIEIDYSKNLFDFIEQIPYTFDYEKINAKG